MTLVSLGLTTDSRSIRLRVDNQPEHRRPFVEADADELRELTSTYDRATVLGDAAQVTAVGQRLARWFDKSTSWLTRLLEDDAFEAPLVLEISGSRKPTSWERALLEAPWELLWFDGNYLAADITVGYAPLRRIGDRKAVRGSRPGALSVLFMAAAPQGPTELDFEAEEALILNETDGLGIDLFVEETGTAKELGRRAARLGADPEHALHVVQLTCHGTNVPKPTLHLEDETGAVAPTSTARLFEELGDRGRELGLLFVSACSTAAGGGFSRDQDSLALGLARTGFPAVLGWAASVFDASATRFAATLYERLGRGDASLENAVAYARRAMLTNAGGVDPHWHLARLFLGPSGGGKLAEPGGPRRKGPPIHGGFLGDDRRSPVAGPDEFVGRRRLLQRCVRTLGRGDRVGVLLHGPGNIGKSSLAARVVDRMSEHEAVVMYGGFDGVNLVKAIKDKLGSRVDDWYRRWSNVADADLGRALRELFDEHLAEHRGNTPLLLVLDDFEQLLEEPPNHSRVRACYQPAVIAILSSFRHANTRSRLLLTTRFKFEVLDVDGRGLTDALELVPVRGFTDREAEKRTRREPAPPRGQPDLRSRCAAASRGNPALLALLLKRATADHDGCVGLLEQIEQIERDTTHIDDEEFLAFLRQIAVTDLLRSLDEGDHELFARSLMFESPLPLAAAGVLQRAGEECSGNAERLIALGVWEEGRDFADERERAFVANALVCGIARRRGVEASAEVHAEISAGLVDMLARRWASMANDTHDPAKTRAGFELAELASKIGDWSAVGLFGRLALAWVCRTRTVADARDYAKQLVEQLEAADVEPEPRLYRDVAMLHEFSAEGELRHRCLARALAAVGTGSKPLSAPERAGIHYQMADSLHRRGEPLLAELELERGKALLVGGSFDYERAVFDGQRADVLEARGELDEALRIRREEQLPFYEQQDNIREWAQTMGKVTDILRAKGEIGQALDTLRLHVLPAFRKLGDDRGWAVSAGKVAEILEIRGDLDEALRIRREEEIPVYERLDDVFLRAVAMGEVADILQVRGEFDEALRIRREEELPVYKRLGDVRARAVTIGKVADILEARGELDEALRIRREEELPAYERMGDVRSQAMTMGKVASNLKARGELDEALRIRREEELPVYERLGDVRSRAVAMGEVADILQAKGEFVEALRIRQEEELPVYERLGDVRERAIAMGKVAGVLEARGELDEALRIRREEIPVYERLGDVRSLLIGRVQLAAILIRRRSSQQEDREIVELLILALRDARQLRVPEARQIEALIRQLGGDPDAPPFA